MEDKKKNTKKEVTETKKNETNNTVATNRVNPKTIIIILSSVIAVCLIVIIILLCLLIKKYDDKSSESSSNYIQSTSSVQDDSNITIGTPDENRDSIEIVTKYGTLMYPKEWEKNLRTEIIDKEEYKVEFYGTVEGKQEQHLFDLNFNGTKGYNLGTLKTDNGEDVQLNIESYEFDFDETWTEEEQNIIYSMTEDINYTIGMLAESGKFTITK